MVTMPNEFRGGETTEALVVDAVPTCQTSKKSAKNLERCDREIAAAMEALLTGSAPIVEALLWYTDWCRERTDTSRVGRSVRPAGSTSRSGSALKLYLCRK